MPVGGLEVEKIKSGSVLIRMWISLPSFCQWSQAASTRDQS